jgi:GNAT superfamily N-acetyltransferase
MTDVISPVLLTKSHIRSEFDCGEELLNRFLKDYAIQNSKNNASRTYVSVKKGTDIVVGYYTLTYGTVGHEEATTKVKKHMPHYPIPVMILARLAVDKNHQQSGLGSGLLRDAILRTIQASSIAGLKAILAHAKNEKALSFYKRFDFESSPIDANHVMLTIQDIASSLNEEYKEKK